MRPALLCCLVLGRAVVSCQAPALPDALPRLPPQVVSKSGATIDDSEMVEGLVLDHKAGGLAEGVEEFRGGKRSMAEQRVEEGSAVVPSGGLKWMLGSWARCLASGTSAHRPWSHAWPTLRACVLRCCLAAARGAGGPTRVENAKVALIQFQVGARNGGGDLSGHLRTLRPVPWGSSNWQAAATHSCCRRCDPALLHLLRWLPCPLLRQLLRQLLSFNLAVPATSLTPPCKQVSPPKTDIENNVIISDYAQMDRILKVGWVPGRPFMCQPPAALKPGLASPTAPTAVHALARVRLPAAPAPLHPVLLSLDHNHMTTWHLGLLADPRAWPAPPLGMCVCRRRSATTSCRW